MTEDAAMQHLRRVRDRKEQAAGQPKFRVVLTARDLKWWETTYERLLSPTVRESRFVSRQTGTSPASASRQASLHGLPGGHQRAGEP